MTMNERTAKALLELIGEYVREQDRSVLALGIGGEAEASSLDEIARRFATEFNREQ
ncbi:hypothetical protein [Curtobacterium oceanosedimentum]|uniref:hypothetical protein n=1 Tax=Curtobacterium oceanosedimentum TaxID=465820 RepID=UPI001CE18825|nr:hypothetical protein [Curtobacterium oceanosedimentum]MCA5922785.1 hypothetical protein [Curtobacterium oceanosedimentum]